MITFHKLGKVSYYCAIVTLTVRRTVFFLDIRLQNAVTLKTGLGSVEVIENVTIR